MNYYAFGSFGGVGGSVYGAPAPAANGPWQISSVQVRSGSRMAQIQISWINQSNAKQSSATFGGGGGNPYQFSVPAGDYLTQITGSVGNYNNSVRLFSLQFFTKNGVQSPVYGVANTPILIFQCPPDYHITGIFGRSGDELDALGVYIEPIPS